MESGEVTSPLETHRSHPSCEIIKKLSVKGQDHGGLPLAVWWQVSAAYFITHLVRLTYMLHLTTSRGTSPVTVFPLAVYRSPPLPRSGPQHMWAAPYDCIEPGIELVAQLVVHS